MSEGRAPGERISAKLHYPFEKQQVSQRLRGRVFSRISVIFPSIWAGVTGDRFGEDWLHHHSLRSWRARQGFYFARHSPRGGAGPPNRLGCIGLRVGQIMRDLACPSAIWTWKRFALPASMSSRRQFPAHRAPPPRHRPDHPHPDARGGA
jgi:hypothetical protein